MGVRKIKFADGENYHVYNRGNSKNQIFHDKADYERFQKMLYLCNGTKKIKFKDFVKVQKDPYTVDKGEPLVDILAYVLMPNHFHLFLNPKSLIGIKKTDINLDNNLSIFTKRLTVSYSKYYNQKYGKTGSLFEGKFKAEHVNNDNYFKYLFSYIHLNPIKIIQKDWKEIGIKDYDQAKRFLNEYGYSSFQDYFLPPSKAGGVKRGEVVNKNAFLGKIEEGTDLSKEIFSWLNFKTIQY